MLRFSLFVLSAMSVYSLPPDLLQITCALSPDGECWTDMQNQSDSVTEVIGAFGVLRLIFLYIIESDKGKQWK